MPYDVVAYEADERTRKLTIGEEGIFHRLLRLAWMNGSIPSNLDDLASLVRIRPTTMQKAWIKLSEMWESTPSDPSRLVNSKQESERVFIELRRAANSEAGKLSAKLRETNRNAPTRVKRGSNSPPLPSPPQQEEHTYGEFGRVRLTTQQHENLSSRMNGSLQSYIDRFDRWVNESPKAKANGVKREDRHAYESIQNWYDRDVKEGRISAGQKPRPDLVF